MPSPPLSCTVRDCGLPLTHDARRFVCERGHSYDIARSGYVNLLQPQDRKSLDAGDSKDVVEARARLTAAGIGRALVDAVSRQVGLLALPSSPSPGIAVDLGSGSGDALGEIADAWRLEGIGIDLSPAAADHAARRFPVVTWVVANADRRLPILDGRANLVLSLHGRRNPAECARVLATGGTLVVAVPAPDDLVELRAHVQGEGVPRERSRALLELHLPLFALAQQVTVRDRVHVTRDVLLNLLATTYRGRRASARDRVETLSDLDVTVASDLFVFFRHS